MFVSNRLAIAGLATLALTTTCAILLITDVLFGTVASVVTTAIALGMFIVLWAVLPLKRRLMHRGEGLPLLDPPEAG